MTSDSVVPRGMQAVMVKNSFLEGGKKGRIKVSKY